MHEPKDCSVNPSLKHVCGGIAGEIVQQLERRERIAGFKESKGRIFKRGDAMARRPQENFSWLLCGRGIRALMKVYSNILG